MQRQHRVTIKEIAAMTGVSTQTVSRVINKRPDVSPETRRSVEAAIAEHGFQPSAVARSLVQRRSQMIGVIVAGLKYYGVAQTVNGMAEATEAAGYSIILKELASFDVPDIVPVVEFFVAHRVEGIIFAPPQMGANIRHLQEQLPPSTPPVIFLKAEPSARFTSIGIDNVEAARTATRHLIALGRRRIAHLAGPLEWREARDRRDGWLLALADAGLEPGPMAAGDWEAASGNAALAQILDEDPTIDGLFVASDQMALGALHVANARGIRIPEQLAVVGFDGYPEAAEFTPSLTTMDQPLKEIGRLAVQELVASLSADHAAGARSIVVPTRMLLGDSAPMPSVAFGAVDGATGPAAGATRIRRDTVPAASS
ncbi:MAG TPA: LacI family DNA-binding transcriptional regulator [Candidatus Limnocylindrales bacterium]|nr:LacI family DNA-binding transcriptional regulator [Candidatus Limnocylindrales bacterium]